jgi:7-cyano-7-deazaguanine synthase in queuosine biosynthesis
MSTDVGPVVILADGTLGALVCAMRESAARTSMRSGGTSHRGILWMPADDRPARARRLHAVKRQADLAGFTLQTERQLLTADSAVARTLTAAGVAEPSITGARTTVNLLSALAEARAIGASQVIWPAHAGADRHGELDIDTLTLITDRALLVSQLAALDSSDAPIRIQTPLAELTDDRLVDLALDLDAPLNAAWWCLNEQPDPCNQCSQCLRWREALAKVDPAQAMKLEALSEPAR